MCYFQQRSHYESFKSPTDSSSHVVHFFFAGNLNILQTWREIVVKRYKILMYSKIFSLLLEVDTTSLSKEVTDKLWRGEETPETDRVLLEDIATKLRKNFLSEIHVCLRELIDKGNQHRNRKSDSGNKDATETLFSHCSSRSVSLIPFVVLLRELMNKHNEDSFHAAIDYLLLLQLDGSNNYFHPFAFRSVLNLLKTWQRAQLVECEQQIIANKAAKRAKRKQKPTATTKPKRSNKAESHEEEEEDAPEQDEDATEEHSEDKALLDVDITTVATLLKELVNLFAVFNLDQWDLELKAHLVEILVELTRGDSEATSVKSRYILNVDVDYFIVKQALPLLLTMYSVNCCTTSTVLWSNWLHSF